MKIHTKTVFPLVVIFVTAIMLLSITPSTFAEEQVTIVTVEGSGFGQDCAESNGGSGCYTPMEATVNVGEKVTMINSDPTGAAHTFTSGTVDGFSPSPDGTFDSLILAQDESYEWSPDTAGNVPYYCLLHTWMVGTIIVQEAGAEEDDSMTDDKMKDDSMTDDKMKDDSMTDDKMKDDSMTDDKMKDDSMTDDKMKDDSMTDDKMKDDSMTDDKMKDDSMTDDKMKDDSMTDDKMMSMKMDLNEIMAEIKTSDGTANEPMTIDLTMTDLDGKGIEHITYNIKATQGSEVILDEESHMHEGTVTNSHVTAALPEDASDSMPVVLTVESVGFGHDDLYVDVPGEIATKQVVPEFGTIAAMVLAVAIISIIAVSARSRLSIMPRL